MIINDLVMSQDVYFTNVQCTMIKKENFVSKNGRIEVHGQDQFKFITKDNSIYFTIEDKNEAKRLISLLNRHYFCLANVTNSSNKLGDGKVFFLNIGCLYNFQRWGKVPVILSDEIKNIIQTKYIKNNKNIEVVLEENFQLASGNNTYFAYTSGKYRLDIEDYNDGDNQNLVEDLTDEIADREAINEQTILSEEKTENPEEKENSKKEILIIYGKNFNFYTSIQGDKYNAKLYVEKVTKRSQQLPLLKIVEGELEFFDHTAFLSKKVKETLETNKGYLDLWNQYADEEGNLLLEKARKVGCISVNREAATIESEGIHLPYMNLPKEAEDLISSDTYLFFSESIPAYLEDSQMTWNEYKILRQEQNKKKGSSYKGEQARVIKRKNGGFVIQTENGYIPPQKFVSLSILGDEHQIFRRENARIRIAEGQAANPALGLILEGKLTEEFSNYSNRKKVMPLSSFVMEKIFTHAPTETQKKAIDIALNTPDIAIIQGPPGTGKTTVITAIIERLNELCDKENKVNGQVLITSFQHDAVRNVIERLRINSLPTMKFGKQERLGEMDLTVENIVEEWCEKYIEKLSEKNPELIELEKNNKFSRLHNTYLIYPSENNALAFLECAKEINLDEKVDNRISKLIESKRVGREQQDSKLLMHIRRLRTTKEGFQDDGADNADELLQCLEDMKINQSLGENAKVFSVLTQAANCFEKEPSDDLLSKLQDVKKYLLEKCIPKPAYHREVVDEDVLDIYNVINQSTKIYQDEKGAILANLLKELRTNRSEVERSLEHYLFVYSATTQQSEGKDIRAAKGIINNNPEEHPEYDTVIVDEAARVSPTDLMIPLAQAKRRIILVGDHRQLPHIYNEEVFESMKSNGETIDMNNIKKSMFEYFLEKAKELEKLDGIRRTIILDAQYRMHPVLGDFVNNTFYKPYDEYFSSPLPALNYEQYISKKNFPVEWYNFPNTYGPERKEGTSRVRECEAEFIVEKIKHYMNLEEGKNLTYGVITFYSAQVNTIKKKLNAKLGDDAKRVRVGSVDAFQGMEFDVIFLSVVRSNDKSPNVRVDKKSKGASIDYEYLEKYKEIPIKDIDKNSDEYKEWETYCDKVGLQNYGFLISENRLCVSLSRQKKLLIVVGNGDMFSKDEWCRIAEVCVPGMSKLYELCKREDVIYDGQSESH